MFFQAILAALCLSLCLGSRPRGAARRLQREENGKLFFGVTYRDFLPTDCLTDIAAFETQALAFYAEAYGRQSIGSNEFDDNNRCNDILSSSAWRNNLQSGEITGHPDFEALGVVDGVRNCAGLNLLPVGSCVNNADNVAANRNQPILSRQLNVNTNSGVPKPQYCSNGETDTCGTGNDGEQSTSTKKFFDMWYNDDPEFNKRIGQRIALDFEGGQFVFDPDSNEAPDFGNDRFANQFFPLSRFKSSGSDFINLNDFNNNPRDAEAWPRATGTDTRGFHFTTELHTTFEFQDSNMQFSFAGDDDFWCFINDRLAIALPGVHGRQVATIDLLGNDANGVPFAQQLGLQVGQVYTLDIYHAERHHTQSNFELETSLAPACNVLQSGTETIDFRNAGSVRAADFVTNGVDLADGQGTFLLSKRNRLFQATSIFTKEVQNLEPGFVASFTVRASADIPNGFAFVIQGDGVVDLPVSINDFNFGGITNSLAVVFDLCRDRDALNPTCDDKEVRIHFPNNRNSGNNAGAGTQQKFEKIHLRNFERGANPALSEVGELSVEIIYFGGDPDFIEVYINDSLFLRQRNFDVANVLGNGGGHVGFTATTSFVSSDLEIRDFVLETVLEETRNTRELFDRNNFQTQRIVANENFESDGFSFQTVDFCENDINTGGLADDFTVNFIEQVPENSRRLQEVVPGTIIDNNDGSYTAVLNTLVVGNFTLDLRFGDFSITLENAYEALAIEDADLLNDEVDGANPLPFVFGGIAIFAFCVLFTFLFVKFRNDWMKNKRYIEEGANFKREMNTTFAGNDEYSVAGKQLLKTQMEINALKAKGVEDTREEDISKLEKENSEMMEVLRADKELNALQNVAVPNNTPTSDFKSKKKQKYKKLDFTI